ncbi:hypothetical protein SADUNF_Sadunf02G0018900 [Salix dunnii]|uniref:Uncharacterized protein n=1 Tax=Salix dunnii TaxID=1413687 RepID=A0A835N5J8_9ROSI|nr:hypothetical protein SADUNF_Sadunf02G0018900 [Salix dunnii]
MSYKNRMQHTLINLKLLLLFLPVLLIFLAMFASKVETFMFPNTKAQYGSADNRNWNLPWDNNMLESSSRVSVQVNVRKFPASDGRGMGAAAKEWPSKSSNAT